MTLGDIMLPMELMWLGVIWGLCAGVIRLGVMAPA